MMPNNGANFNCNPQTYSRGMPLDPNNTKRVVKDLATMDPWSYLEKTNWSLLISFQIFSHLWTPTPL